LPLLPDVFLEVRYGTSTIHDKTAESDVSTQMQLTLDLLLEKKTDEISRGAARKYCGGS